MPTDRHDSVWFHLYEDRERAAALELRSTLMLELEKLLDSDRCLRSKIDPSHLSVIERGLIADITTSALARIVHDLGYRIEAKLVPSGSARAVNASSDS